MKKNQTILQEEIVDVAFRHARDGGLAAVNMRAVAHDCGIAVGTVYNHFPDKAALVTKVIERFWTKMVLEENGHSCFAWQPGENFVEYCRRAALTLHAALGEFREDWLADVSNLDARTRHRGREAERSCFEHIRRSLELVIKADGGIDPEALERTPPSELAAFVWTTMLEYLRAGDPSCKTLFSLLDAALYPCNPADSEAARAKKCQLPQQDNDNLECHGSADARKEQAC